MTNSPEQLFTSPGLANQSSRFEQSHDIPTLPSPIAPEHLNRLAAIAFAGLSQESLNQPNSIPLPRLAEDGLNEIRKTIQETEKHRADVLATKQRRQALGITPEEAALLPEVDPFALRRPLTAGENEDLNIFNDRNPTARNSLPRFGTPTPRRLIDY